MEFIFSNQKNIKEVDINNLFLRANLGRDIKKPGQWKEILNRSEAVISVWNNKRLVAFGRLWNRLDSIVIYETVVDPDFQRGGLGTKIISELEKEAVRNGHKSLITDTEIDNISAQKFFVKNEFVETHRSPAGTMPQKVYFKKKLL